MDVERHLFTLLEFWNHTTPRRSVPDSEWIGRFVSLLHGLIDLRVRHVRLWLDSNLGRFQAGHPSIEDLLRRFDSMVIEMRANVQLCGFQCALCHLLCIRGRLHEGDHSCKTTHKCMHDCTFCEGGPKPCGSRYVLCPLIFIHYLADLKCGTSRQACVRIFLNCILPFSYQRLVVWSTLICVANHAPFLESKGVWTTVPKWATEILLELQAAYTFSGCRSCRRQAQVLSACSHVWRSMILFICAVELSHSNYS